jgi:hypothetical protein
MYKFPEDSFLRSDDLAKKYFENIEIALLNNDPGKIQMELKFLFTHVYPHQNNQYLIIFIFLIEAKKLFHEINLNKVIEEKLTNNSRVMNTIGRPIKIEFNQKKDLTLSKNAAKVYFKKSN